MKKLTSTAALALGLLVATAAQANAQSNNRNCFSVPADVSNSTFQVWKMDNQCPEVVRVKYTETDSIGSRNQEHIVGACIGVVELTFSKDIKIQFTNYTRERVGKKSCTQQFDADESKKRPIGTPVGPVGDPSSYWKQNSSIDVSDDRPWDGCNPAEHSSNSSTVCGWDGNQVTMFTKTSKYGADYAANEAVFACRQRFSQCFVFNLGSDMTLTPWAMAMYQRNMANLAKATEASQVVQARLAKSEAELAESLARLAEAERQAASAPSYNNAAAGAFMSGFGAAMGAAMNRPTYRAVTPTYRPAPSYQAAPSQQAVAPSYSGNCRALRGESQQRCVQR